MDYRGLSKDDHGLSGIMVGRLHILDYRRLLLWTIIDYELPGIIADYHSYNIGIITDDHGLSRIIMDY